MSGDRTTPRFDVIATTRRSWSKQQKRAIVAEVDVGGATLSEVARRHGIHSSLLFRWRRDLGLPLAPPPIDAPTPTRAPSFVPVMLEAPTTSMPEPSVASQPGAIEIVIAGGRTVRVGTDVDTAALVRIIAALEGAR
jgi:transposase